MPNLLFINLNPNTAWKAFGYKWTFQKVDKFQFWVTTEQAKLSIVLTGRYVNGKTCCTCWTVGHSEAEIFQLFALFLFLPIVSAKQKQRCQWEPDRGLMKSRTKKCAKRGQNWIIMNKKNIWLNRTWMWIPSRRKPGRTFQSCERPQKRWKLTKLGKI